MFDPNHHNWTITLKFSCSNSARTNLQRNGMASWTRAVMSWRQIKTWQPSQWRLFLLSRAVAMVFQSQLQCWMVCRRNPQNHTKPSTSKSPKIPQDPNSSWFSAQSWVDFNGEWRFQTASNRLMPMDVHWVTDSGNENISVFMSLACGDLNRLVLHSPTSPVRGSPLNETLQERRRHCFNCVTGRVGR